MLVKHNKNPFKTSEESTLLIIKRITSYIFSEVISTNEEILIKFIRGINEFIFKKITNN